MSTWSDKMKQSFDTAEVIPPPAIGRRLRVDAIMDARKQRLADAFNESEHPREGGKFSGGNAGQKMPSNGPLMKANGILANAATKSRSPRAQEILQNASRHITLDP